MNKSLILLAFLILLSCSLPKLPLYIGKGYNLLKGNPMSATGVDPGFNHQIFQFTYNTSAQTQDGKYLIPDNISHRKTTACSFSTKISEFRGTQSYQKDLKTKTQISGGYNGTLVKASFSHSSSFEKIHNETVSQNMTVTHATAQCQCYQMSLNLFKVNPITDNFWTGVKSSYQKNDWAQFIDQFGSHFVYEVIMGGRAAQQIQYDWKSVSQLQSLNIDINIAAKASYAKFFADASFDYHKYENQTKYVESLSRSINQLYVGGKPPTNGNISEWQKRIIDDPMPINYKILPISDLFQHYSGKDINVTDAKTKFYAALDKYCSINNCVSPTPDKPKPPLPTIDIKRSFAYGGNGGGPFQWYHSHPTLNLKKIILRSGKQIDKVQFFLSDGITSLYSPEYGGGGGGAQSWTVPDKEYITQLQYRSGDRVDSLIFITNKGTKSPQYGGGGGGYHLETIPQGYRIVGLYGRSGSRVDRLGLVLAKTIYKAGQVQEIIVRKNLIIDE